MTSRHRPWSEHSSSSPPPNSHQIIFGISRAEAWGSRSLPCPPWTLPTHTEGVLKTPNLPNRRMEAVGLAASIIALLGVANKLAQVVGSLLGGTAESTIVMKRIVLDLTAVHECLERSDSVEAGQDLHEACSDLEASLTACLSECMNLSAEGDSCVTMLQD
ncbi:hypothetical protein CPB85DRAFT_1441909 [Mucidula mucida]|nr:hypothetical protein CPB85DRAFT_1441909 [Mucidula mucida]